MRVDAVRRRAERRAWVAAVVLAIAATGCGHHAPPMTSAPDSNIKPLEVNLGPGDEIEVKFFNVPELNELQTVRPDGRISLQLVGEVWVEGSTPDELRGELVRLYTPQLKKPEITVIVRSLRSNRVFVGGEVNSPGMIEMPGRMNVLDAVMQAGGFNMKTAQIKNVVIIRHKNGHRYGGSLDFRPMLEGKEGPAFYLEPYDIVYVPRTAIVRVAQWIDQHINQMVPQFGLVIYKRVGDYTIGLDTSPSRPRSP